MICYTAIERSKLLKHAICMNFENIVPSKRSQTWKGISARFHIQEVLKYRKSIYGASGVGED